MSTFNGNAVDLKYFNVFFKGVVHVDVSLKLECHEKDKKRIPTILADFLKIFFWYGMTDCLQTTSAYFTPFN